MRIEDLGREDVAGAARVRARIVWEGPRRGPEVLWFETDARFGDDFDPAPEAFLLAALPLAAALGEPRLRVQGRVDARLFQGLGDAMRLLASWYPRCRALPIEATGGSVALVPRAPPRVALFLSGGVDSLSLLRANRLAFPFDHPEAIRDGVHLFGGHTHDFDGSSPRPERLRRHRERVDRLAEFGATEGVEVVPVWTNIRTFHPPFAWWRDVAFGAAIISVAHAFPRRFRSVLFGGGGFPGTHPPHASHPALDPLYSSGAVEVVHGESHRTRLEKVRALAAWPSGMSVLDVCFQHDVSAPGVVNCGRCEKCVRTLLELTAVGGLDAAVTFPDRASLLRRLREVRLSGGHNDAYLGETLVPLEAVGRHDLAKVLRRKLRRSEGRAARRARWWRRLARALRPRRASRHRPS